MNPHFASMVVGLAQQAEGALRGELPPGGEAAPGGPKQVAQTLIDTLGMLQEKTAGNLEEAEAQLLSQALVTLRFQFVKVHGPS